MAVTHASALPLNCWCLGRVIGWGTSWGMSRRICRRMRRHLRKQWGRLSSTVNLAPVSTVELAVSRSGAGYPVRSPVLSHRICTCVSGIVPREGRQWRASCKAQQGEGQEKSAKCRHVCLCCLPTPGICTPSPVSKAESQELPF